MAGGFRDYIRIRFGVKRFGVLGCRVLGARLHGQGQKGLPLALTEGKSVYNFALGIIQR